MTMKRLLHLILLPLAATGVGGLLVVLVAGLIALALGQSGIESLADLGVLNARGLDIYSAGAGLRRFLNQTIYLAGGAGVSAALLWLLVTGLRRPAVPAALNSATFMWWGLLLLAGVVAAGIAFWIWSVDLIVRRDLNLLIVGPALAGALLLYWLLTLLFTRAAFVGQVPLAVRLPTRWRKW